MEKRTLGSTGDSLSILGFGGVTLVGLNQDASNELVENAIDNGINYFDVAPSYGKNQETEVSMGTALRSHRKNVFLACKTGCRDAKGASEEMLRSLNNLQTDYFDLYQLHALSSVEDVQACFAPGGAMDCIIEAQRKGQIRHIGFSAHSSEAALLAMEMYPFASALFPVNFVIWQEGHFGPEIAQKAAEKNVGRLALKAMARTNWAEGAVRDYPNCWYEPLTDAYHAELALRWTLSKDITAAIPPGDPRLFALALKIAKNFTPIDSDQLNELQNMATGLAPLFKVA